MYVRKLYVRFGINLKKVFNDFFLCSDFQLHTLNPNNNQLCIHLIIYVFNHRPTLAILLFCEYSLQSYISHTHPDQAIQYSFRHVRQSNPRHVASTINCLPIAPTIPSLIKSMFRKKTSKKTSNYATFTKFVCST